MDSMQSHKADVFDIFCVWEWVSAYSCGMDCTLMHFQVIVEKGWNENIGKSLHRGISAHNVSFDAPGGLHMTLIGAGDRSPGKQDAWLSWPGENMRFSALGMVIYARQDTMYSSTLHLDQEPADHMPVSQSHDIWKKRFLHNVRY